jgi:hypothetical protein
MLTMTKLDFPAPSLEAAPDHDIEVLFREAKRRARRRRLTWLSVALLVLAGTGVGFAMHASAIGSAPKSSGGTSPRVAKSSSVKILTCRGTDALKPSTFVISCADGNSELTQTHWSTWNAAEAIGTTRFALNLCKPYCAASGFTYFPHSTVRLSAPEATPHGTLFSSLVVRYQLDGVWKTFAISWKGDPSFSS